MYLNLMVNAHGRHVIWHSDTADATPITLFEQIDCNALPSMLIKREDWNQAKLPSRPQSHLFLLAW